jgi:acetoin utilization deacetylase AcuC-like enzyme
MRRVGYLSDPRYLEHLTGPTHPERPERLEAIMSRVDASGLSSDLVALKASPAETVWIEKVHDPAYVRRVKASCERGDAILDSMDTGISKRSYDTALLATGAGIAAADALVEGGVAAAFAAVRPPGHHALRKTAMGFCLFNSAAIVARYLQGKHGLKKIFILDWDVHHGNGTQDAFYSDPTVFYASIHQYPYYPGTGAAGETGEEEGAGFTLNAPMPAGCGDGEYRRVFEEVFLPAFEGFRPDALIVSAGFDAHRRDPLAGMEVTEEGYAAMTRCLLHAAESVCPGRFLSILEGGYDLDALAASVEAHLGTLLRG